MLKIVETEDYIKFDWDTGYLIIKKSKFDKLSRKKKDLLYSLGNKSTTHRERISC